MNPSRIRVAMLIDVYGSKFIGGGQVHVKNLQTKLETNHHCQVVIFSQPYPHFMTRLLWGAWVIPSVILSHLRKPFSLLHSHGYHPGLSAKILSILLKIPVVHTVHGSSVLDISPHSFQGKLERWLLVQIQYDALISVSKKFLKHKPRSNSRFHISNGVDTHKFRPLYSFQKQRKDTVRLLFVGRLETVKGVAILIRAMAGLASLTNRQFHLDIVGEGSLKPELHSLVRSLRLTKCVTFRGRQTPDRLAQIYNRSHLLVLPSAKGEGQPLTILEAWACKIPVLATRVGDLPLLVKEGQNGYLAEPDDIGSLHSKLLCAFEEFATWTMLGENGYRFVASHCSWDTVAQKTYNIYCQLTSVR